MGRHAFALLLFTALPASAVAETDARAVLRQALESQLQIPEAPPKLPSSRDPHGSAETTRAAQAVFRLRQAVQNVAADAARTDVARQIADRAAESSGSPDDKAANSAGQVRAADVRAYGDVKKEHNSASVGEGNGQGNNAGGNGKGKGKGKGNSGGS